MTFKTKPMMHIFGGITEQLKYKLSAGIANEIFVRNITQTVAADLCDVPRERICNIVNGKLDNISLEYIANVASCFGYFLTITKETTEKVVSPDAEICRLINS